MKRRTNMPCGKCSEDESDARFVSKDSLPRYRFLRHHPAQRFEGDPARMPTQPAKHNFFGRDRRRMSSV
jgi:hypothetical protein